MLGYQIVSLRGDLLTLDMLLRGHMLSTPTVNHCLLPYGSIISKILRHFDVPLLDAVYTQTKRIGWEAMTSIGFSRKNGQWIQTKNSKNWDTSIAPEDDRMLNNIYPPDQLPNFRLGAHPPPPRRWSVPQAPTDFDTEEREMDTDIPSTFEPPLAPEQPIAPKSSFIPKQPPPSTEPPASDTLQQLVDDICILSKRQ